MYVFLAYSRRLLLCCQAYINDQFWAIAFNTCINGLCAVINHCFLFVGNLEDLRAIKSIYDCSLLQSNIDCIRERCSANFMKLNFGKIRVASFTRKTVLLNYQYDL